MEHSTDMEGRIKRHNSGSSKPTKYGIPWGLFIQKTLLLNLMLISSKCLKSKKSRDFIKKLIEQ